MNHDEILNIPEPEAEELFGMIESSMDGLRRMYVLRGALEEGVFERLKRPKDPRAMARESGMDEGLAILLCESLTAMGLLETDGHGNYVNSRMAATYLVRGSPHAQERSLQWTWTGMERWKDLRRYLRSGPDLIRRTDFFNEGWIHGIAERALCGGVQKVVGEMTSLVDMSGGKRLLDLGGGHGLYSIAFCAKVPGLRAVVFDLPQVVPLTHQYIERYGASSVEVVSGDFTRDDIGSGYDLVFSSFNNSGTDQSMVPKVASALRPGGHLLLRQFSEQAKNEPLAGLEWNFVTIEGMGRERRRFSGPRSCSLEEYGRALEASGFEIVRHWDCDRMSELMVARKGAE